MDMSLMTTGTVDEPGSEGKSNDIDKAIYPPGTILDDWMKLGRDHCECEDAFILGAILPVCGAILGRRAHFYFGQRKYPNCYSLLVAKAGLRKSTLIKLAERVAKQVLPASSFTSAMASEEALFDEYYESAGGTPDKILIEDEGNTILTRWAESNYGKAVAKRYLKLYDCDGWRQSFKRNGKDSGVTVLEIPETSTSVLIGVTLGKAKFQRLESRDGLRRRFLTYRNTKLARTIFFPPPIESKGFRDFCLDLSTLSRIEGEIGLTATAKEEFCTVQTRNRQRLNSLPDSPSESNDAMASLLASEPMHVLKIAAIFACVRFVSQVSQVSRPVLIDGDDIVLASRHVDNCIEATRWLEYSSEEERTSLWAEKVYAGVRNNTSRDGIDQMEGANGSFSVIAKRHALTYVFCNHKSSKGSLNTTELYERVIPFLVRTKKCSPLPNEGRGAVWAFHYQD